MRGGSLGERGRGMVGPVALLLAVLGLCWSLLLAGVGCLFFALYRAFASVFATPAALALTGIVAIVLAGIGLLLGRRREPAPSLTALGPDLIREYPFESTAAAVAAGILCQQSPELVSALGEQLGQFLGGARRD